MLTWQLVSWLGGDGKTTYSYCLQGCTLFIIKAQNLDTVCELIRHSFFITWENVLAVISHSGASFSMVAAGQAVSWSQWVTQYGSSFQLHSCPCSSLFWPIFLVPHYLYLGLLCKKNHLVYAFKSVDRLHISDLYLENMWHIYFYECAVGEFLTSDYWNYILTYLR